MMSPLPTVSMLSGSCEILKIFGLPKLCVGGVPERCRRAQGAACGPPVLFEIVSEAEHGSGDEGVSRIAAFAAGRTPFRAGPCTSKWCLLAMNGACEFGECGFRPVIAQLIVVVVG
jgi:hypothetical protein